MSNNLREQLFPDGEPTPEEAIRTLVLYLREQFGMDDNNALDEAEAVN